MRTEITRYRTSFPYIAGEPLLESARDLPVQPLPLLKGGGDPPKDVGFWEIFTPGKDDFKGLKKGLAFAKVTADQQEALFNFIGGAANMVGGVISIVGAAGAALDLLTKIGVLSEKADATQTALKKIGEDVHSIYIHLANQERRGLYNSALVWRNAADGARSAVVNAVNSRTPENLRTLVDRAEELDKAINEMLDAGSGNITFLRSNYSKGATPPWINYAKSPIMSTADGKPINYSDPVQELRTEIWDVGYYLDVLLRALTDRVVVATTIEPAFRSTGHERWRIASIAEQLLVFIHAWRAAILVADPVYALNPGGKLRSATWGLPVGAIDPVTGISSFNPIWQGFAIEGKVTRAPLFIFGTVVVDEEARAIDPAAALAAVLPVHQALVDQVVKACGIERLMALQRQLRELGSPPVGSDFVSLRDATFHRQIFRVELWGSESRPVADAGEPVTVDLGRFKVFARDPAKTYAGRRHVLHGHKQFTFRMARRADFSNIRLGYRLRLGMESITLMEYESGGEGGEAFPTTPIERLIEIRTKVYDVHQTGHFSTSEENSFERDGKVPGEERLFLNERDGLAKFHVRVAFTPFAGGATQGYAGEATVTIEAVDPTDRPDGSIIEVMVFETHAGLGAGTREEVIADSMTLHLVPTYIVLGPDYFADRFDAMARAARSIKHINERFSMEQVPLGPPRPEPDPRWNVRERFGAMERQIDVLDQLRGSVDGLDETLADNLAPFVRGG